MLNPVQRLYHEDQLMGLIARCLILQHPHRVRMAGVTLSHAAALSDEKLLALNERLSAWVADADAALPSLPAATAEVG